VVAKADPSLPIVIDPILQSTYLGGKADDKVKAEVKALAIHPSTGDVYVAGYTNSTNFPKTNGGAQAAYGGGDYTTDVFVTRLNSNLTQIIQSTYLGGSENDGAYALAIHPTTGDIYVAGWASTDFPKTNGGAQAGKSGFEDAFVAKLNSNLTQIIQSTYLGGSGLDVINALAIHPKTGDIYVAGLTYSTDFPKTTGGAQAIKSNSTRTSIDSTDDGFVSRFKPDLTQIIQSTYLGGSENDGAYALAIHPKTGDIYVAGYTESTDFPKTNGGAQAGSKGGYGDNFVAKLNSNLTQIIQSTYLGGSGLDMIYALAIHPSTGDVYVAGVTDSTDFPKTNGGAVESYGGGIDAFVTRLSADLAAISSYDKKTEQNPSNSKDRQSKKKQQR